MADPFFRFQNAAQNALSKHPGRRIQYVPGQGYRLVAGTPTPQTNTQQGLPAYTPPAPTSLWEQANTRAKDIYQPILDMIQQQYERQRGQAEARTRAQIAAAEKAYASARAPISNLYNSAIGQATNIEEAVANRLENTGEERGADLAARLEAMGAPETGASGELATTYQGAEAANYAKGMSDVGRLVSRGAEARNWLEKQPLIYREQAESELAQALAELSGSFESERGQIIANIPQQVSDLYDRIYGQTNERNQMIYEDRWKRVEWLRQQRLDAVEQQIAARELGDAQAERRWKTQQANLDRQLEREQADLNRTFEQTQGNVGLASDEADRMTQATGFIHVVRNGKVVNTGKRVVSGGPTEEEPEILPKYVADSVWNSVFPGYGNKMGGWSPAIVRAIKASPKNADSLIAGALNAQMKAYGVDPKSEQGRNLREGILRRLNGKLVPGVGPYRWP